MGWVKTSPHISRFVLTVNGSRLSKGRGNPVILYISNLSISFRDGSERERGPCNIDYTPHFMGTLYSQNQTVSKEGKYDLRRNLSGNQEKSWQIVMKLVCVLNS